MQRQRVVNLAANLPIRKILPQRIAARSPNHILVEDMPSPRIGEGKHHASIRTCPNDPRSQKQLVVIRGQIPPLLIPLRQIFQLYLQHRSLQAIQPGVPPYLFVVIALPHPMGAKHPCMIVKSIGNGRQQPRIAKRAKVFVG